MIPIVPERKPYTEKDIFQLPRSSSKNKKDIKCAPFRSTWHSITWNLLLFSTSRWRICPDVTMWEEPVDLVRTCLAHSSSALSLSALEASLYLILWWNSGPQGWQHDVDAGQNPSGSGWLFLFTSFRGLTYKVWQFLLWPEIASLDQRSQVPDDCTETTEERCSAWDLCLKPSYTSYSGLLHSSVQLHGCLPKGPCPFD